MATDVANVERVDEPDGGEGLRSFGQGLMRYGLALVLVWLGALKLTPFQAETMEPFLANSPLTAWALRMFGLRTVAGAIGIVEIVLGLMIATRLFAPRLSAAGSIGASLVSLLMLTFLVTTPGVWDATWGFPYPSRMPGQFLIKDLLFLGASLWTAGEAMRAAAIRRERLFRPTQRRLETRPETRPAPA